jgi:superoxide dismutase, Fe-Mn family
VLLTFLPRDRTLVNQWAADHTDAVAGAIPILTLDMYEHAHHIDYGAAAAAFVDAFMTNLDWAQVYDCYQAAVHGASLDCRRQVNRTSMLVPVMGVGIVRMRMPDRLVHVLM